MRPTLFLLSVVLLLPVSCLGTDDGGIPRKQPLPKQAADAQLDWDSAKEALVVYLGTEKGADCSCLRDSLGQLVHWHPESVDPSWETVWLANWEIDIGLEGRWFGLDEQGLSARSVYGRFEYTQDGLWKAIVKERVSPLHPRH
jgi:hypothetical protein